MDPTIQLLRVYPSDKITPRHEYRIFTPVMISYKQNVLQPGHHIVSENTETERWIWSHLHQKRVRDTPVCKTWVGCAMGYLWQGTEVAG